MAITILIDGYKEIIVTEVENNWDIKHMHSM